MAYLLPIFKSVSVIFAVTAVATGLQSILDPIGFSKGFGLTLSPKVTDAVGRTRGSKGAPMSEMMKLLRDERSSTTSYISLMGVRQLAIGVILLTFAYQDKWTEMATILAIIGVLVAGTDGIYLARGGTRNLGLFHAIPGALISALALAVIFLDG